MFLCLLWSSITVEFRWNANGWRHVVQTDRRLVSQSSRLHIKSATFSYFVAQTRPKLFVHRSYLCISNSIAFYRVHTRSRREVIHRLWPSHSRNTHTHTHTLCDGAVTTPPEAPPLSKQSSACTCVRPLIKTIARVGVATCLLVHARQASTADR